MSTLLKCNFSQKDANQNNLCIKSDFLYKILVLERRQEENDTYFYPAQRLSTFLLFFLNKAMGQVFESGKRN